MSQPTQFIDQERVVKLWLHESERIYCDRLVSEANMAAYKNLAFDTVKKSFAKYNMQRYFAGAKPESLLFINFTLGYANDRFYDVIGLPEAEKHVNDALIEYNDNFIEMNLVLFDDAVKHVCRITRITSNPAGHALLVGVGGSGKQSLSKLSAFVNNLTTFSITVSSSYGMNDLKNDLLSLYTKTGLKDDGILFLITDSHITNERFLVYINDLLSSGEIAELYTEDDKMNIVNQVRPKVKSEGLVDTPDNCWTWYIEKVVQNLHVCLCCSPVGEQFRRRAKRFPALVTCTVYNRFHP